MSNAAIKMLRKVYYNKFIQCRFYDVCFCKIALVVAAIIRRIANFVI